MTRRRSRTARVLVSRSLAVVLFLAQSNLPAFVTHAQSTRAAGQGAVARLERLYDALAAVAVDIPRDTFDPQAVLELTDKTPDGVFAWLRDNTVLVPYRGVLRGPTGVLMDRVGNSLDRSLLLQDLLRRLGYETRLARAELTAAQQADVLERSAPVPFAESTPRLDVAIVDAMLSAYAERFGLDAGELSAASAATESLDSTLSSEALRRVTEQVAAIMDAVQSSELDVVEASSDPLPALRDHWWVQYRTGDGWTDLDPTYRDATPGQAVAAPDQTVVVGSWEDDLRNQLQAVQVRVVLECARAGILEEHVLLESPALAPGVRPGQRLSLEYFPLGWDTIAGASDDASELQAILQQDHWVPVLKGDGEAVFDRGFSASCDVEPATVGWVGGVADVFGAAADALDPFAATPTDDEGAVSSLWLEYVIAVPEAPVQTVRRQVFDLTGAAARAAAAPAAGASASAASAGERSEADELDWRLALLGRTDILLLGGRLSPDYVSLLLAEHMQSNRGGLTQVASEPTDFRSAHQLLKSNPPLMSDLLSLVLARQSWQELTGPVYQGRPSIFSHHRRPSRTTEGTLSQMMAFDIVSSPVEADPRVGTSPFAAHVTQGVVDANLEAMFATLTCQTVDPDAACVNSGNTANAFEASLRHGVPWRLVSDRAGLAGLAWPEDALARAYAEVAKGHWLLLPEQPVDGHVSWWRIDTVRGEVIGTGDLGWGQGAEYAQLINTFTVAAGFFYCLKGATNGGKSFVTPKGMKWCVAGAAIGMIGVLTGSLVLGAVVVLAATIVSGEGGSSP